MKLIVIKWYSMLDHDYHSREFETMRAANKFMKALYRCSWICDQQQF